MTVITSDERAIYDKISHLGALLWDASLKVVGLNSDPKMFSIMLFKRLWSNHRGYSLLHKNAFSLEADIVLRSGLEAAICIAANYRLREEFLLLMRRDAAYSLQGQIKVHRDSGAFDLVKDCEATLRQLHAGMPEGVKAARLNWNTLAQKGQVPQLYSFHRMLSGVSSHVTGISVLQGVVDADGGGADTQNEIRNLSRRLHLMMMAGATLQGSMLHAGMIGEDELVRTAKSLVDQLNVISTTWT
ncbi:MAG: hypothetical protein KJ871_00320 [Alphaproteobacteria bacterium]|nr:hypothetical protein [Alphaproteobacteria bacterium]MBU2083763.1 hypothetical protein [Alphaproteobacteria bacterium]MBU2142549.1 hypothetical protein [Alphaproteobacteria bacterium]MBU2197698.1 hypothetical protein [Alphaproteobacteria bacterium]